MKKFIVPAMFALALGFTSCSADKVEDALGLDCISIASKYFDALQNFENEQTTENCEALRKAIEEYKTADCEGSEDLVEAPTCG